MRLVLVRHGEAAAGWGQDSDPGLSDLGRQQAHDVAEQLAPLGPRPILTSPLRRCRETAAPLSERWGVDPLVTTGVGEIRAPDDELTARDAWLRDALTRPWNELPDAQRRWRDDVVACLLAQTTDCVVFTHFVAINVAIGAATANDMVVCRRVGNCSVTLVESDARGLSLLESSPEIDHTVVL